VAARRYRRTAVDQAGNTSVVVSDLAPQEVIVHLWDGVPVPTSQALEQSLGAHRLATAIILHASIQSVRVQTRLQGSAVWVDQTIVPQPPPSLEVLWDNSAFIGGRTYDVRLVARDANGVEVSSNTLSIHSNLFEFTAVESTVNCGNSNGSGSGPPGRGN